MTMLIPSPLKGMGAMSGRLVGSLVGLGFGLTYLLVNNSRLPGMLPAIVTALAVLAAVAFVVTFWRNRGLLLEIRSGESADPFRGKFGLITAVEVLAIFGGLFVLNAVLGRPEAAIAWITTVVGAHFYPMGRVTKMPMFTTLAYVLTPLGVLGLVLAFGGAPRWWVDLAAGVLPGIVLVWFALWGISAGARAEQRRMQGAAA